MRHLAIETHAHRRPVLLHLALLAPVQAQDAATSFEGTHDAGGTVRFTIGADGGQIVALELEGLAGGGCSWDTVDLGELGRRDPVRGRRFAATNADGDAIQGAVRGCEPCRRDGAGARPGKGCETPPLRWVASRADP